MIKSGKEFGRPAVNNAEAWKRDREVLHKILRKKGLESFNPSTDFVPEQFFVGKEFEEYYKKSTPESLQSQK